MTKIHPTAILEQNIRIGQDTRIWANTHILEHVKIGRNCNICDNVFIENNVTIGDHCTIKNGVSLWSGVTLEDYVFIGPNAVFTNDLMPRSHPSFKTPPEKWLKTNIHKGATIGANATIVCGNTIGSWAFIGAGAVVTKEVPAYGLVIGNPAKLVGYVCKCTHRLEEKNGIFQCHSCSRKYSKYNLDLKEF